MVKEDFFWGGGRLWLDLVNTERMLEGARVDFLADAAALLVWLEATESTPVESQLWPEAQQQELLAQAKDLRQLLRGLCKEWTAEGRVSESMANALNEWLRPPAPGLRLVAHEDSWQLEDAPAPLEPLHLLYPIARSAANSIVQGELKLLRACGNPGCIRWFLDTSKNHSRRWCSMEGCGNRHKVAEHYRRKKEL